MPYLPYNKTHKKLSRYLRNNSTLSEVLLWNELKGAQMMGYTFNRQKPLLNFIVDFYCKPLKLVIEIDGDSHDNELEDEKREKNITALGVHFLRFNDRDVKSDMVNVLRAIENYIKNFEENK